VSAVAAGELPRDSFLISYRERGAFADCYSTVVPGAVTLEQYVRAFYTSPLFKVERFILTWAVRKPSTDEDATRLASGAASAFSAWTTEQRSGDQLLMCDIGGRTRSWFMVTPDTGGTRLYFGSAVVPGRDGRMGSGFSALLWFHKLYSLALLRAARGRAAISATSDTR
jgi:hypothetical protein